MAKMEKSGFKDPIESKIKVEEIDTPWCFKAPSYDQSKLIQAGDNYGVGYKAPVGRVGNPKMKADTLPQGRVNTMRTDNLPYKKTKVYEAE